jgi:hypothetical protein
MYRMYRSSQTTADFHKADISSTETNRKTRYGFLTINQSA